jgi:TatA/E family protein of Tat protein translocase
MPQVGPLEILVIFVVALLVFGPDKIPQLVRQVGRAYREFRQFQESLHRDIEDTFGAGVDDDKRGSPPPTLPPKEVGPLGEPPYASTEAPVAASHSPSAQPPGPGRTQ